MKKLIFCFAILMAFAPFWACSSDDDPETMLTYKATVDSICITQSDAAAYMFKTSFTVAMPDGSSSAGTVSSENSYEWKHAFSSSPVGLSTLTIKVEVNPACPYTSDQRADFPVTLELATWIMNIQNSGGIALGYGAQGGTIINYLPLEDQDGNYLGSQTVGEIQQRVVGTYTYHFRAALNDLKLYDIEAE
ncbi:MAG: hypothetical protein LIO91_02770 [Bacteroidales bacterium]|nr:hypothetical protein [Bacteroidales bacterium]